MRTVVSHVGILYHDRPVPEVIYGPGFTTAAGGCAGDFLNDHPVQCVVFEAVAKLVSDGLADRPGAVDLADHGRRNNESEAAIIIVYVIGAKPARMDTARARIRSGGILNFFQYLLPVSVGIID